MSEVAKLRPQKSVSAQSGYSLIELMFVTGIMGVLIGIAVVQIGLSKQGLNGDGAMRAVLAQANQDKADAKYYRSAASDALLSGKISAGVGILKSLASVAAL